MAVEEELFNEDEVPAVKKAIQAVRARGFGVVSLYFRNGYIYSADAQLKYLAEVENEQKKNS